MKINLNKRIVFLYFILSTLIAAQDFTDIRIYINPGHGGHDSDDRYISTTGFWESDGNLAKGLHLKAILDSLNATTRISRSTNNTSDDLPLSVIVADANNFDADYFQSIHSNAGFTGSSNYTLILFQGLDNSPTYPEAKTMGSYLADEIYKAHRTSTKYNRGDADFYGTGQPYLGVLKGLTMPGTLSEGSFHDYIPESYRLRNDAYTKHEAWAITKAFVKYFNLGQMQYGEIAGCVRDAFQTVDYSYINGTKDKYKPANLVKAILLPDSIVYNGDSFNNGFYLFDKVNQGNYQLIVEAENYQKDTFNVVVENGKTTFLDPSLIEAPNYSAPVIQNRKPQETENVRLDSKIILDFNVKMDKANTQFAFKISPSVQGTFSWENNDKRLIFTPTNYLAGGTVYTVSLSIFAKSYYGTLIQEPFQFSFTTRSGMKLVNSYPIQNSENISRTVKIILKFDGELNVNTLGGNIFFQDENNNDIDLVVVEVNNEIGVLTFEPINALEPNAKYQIKIFKGLSDTEGSNLISDSTIFFTTENSIQIEGNILSDFEQIENWSQPNLNENSHGIDLSYTKFQITKNKFISASNSGNLKYKFISDSLGICQVKNISSNLNVDLKNNLGIWIFGDLSFNNVQLWFSDADNNLLKFDVGILDWTGWKYKILNISDQMNLKFNSIVIEQIKNAGTSGEIYFDDILYDVITEIKNENINLPENFVLRQNYPNPFNPITTIEYSVPIINKYESSNEVNPNSTNVQLFIYDILGRKVETLIKQKQKPGNYKLTWDAANYSSGVYYYKLQIGDLISIKKMILMK